MFRTLIPALLILLTLPAMTYAEDVPVVRLDATPTGAIFEDASRMVPVELNSAEEAAEYFEGDALEALNEQVDWETQSVLAFAWRGSGGDRMDVEVNADGVEFIYRPGRTRDLRPHVAVFAVQNDVDWRVVGGPGPGPGGR